MFIITSLKGIIPNICMPTHYLNQRWFIASWTPAKFESKHEDFHSTKCFFTMLPAKWWPFCSCLSVLRGTSRCICGYTTYAEQHLPALVIQTRGLISVMGRELKIYGHWALLIQLYHYDCDHLHTFHLGYVWHDICTVSSFFLCDISENNWIRLYESSDISLRRSCEINL